MRARILRRSSVLPRLACSGVADRFARAALQFAVQSDDRLERLVADAAGGSDRRQPERLEQMAALGSVQLDLERRALGRRRFVEEVCQLHAHRGRDGLELREPRLALAVLDEGELTTGEPDLRRRAGPASSLQWCGSGGCAVPAS